MSDRDEVADVLAAHRLTTGMEYNECACGWIAIRREGAQTAYLTHLADALMPLLARREAEARAEVVARLTPLADKWEGYYGSREDEYDGGVESGMYQAAEDLRAALTPRNDQEGS